MTNNKNILNNVKECNVIIKFANGNFTRGTHIGTYVGYVYNNKVTLRNVIYVPDFQRSLLCISGLSEDDYITVFKKGYGGTIATVYDKNHKRVFTSKANEYKVYRIYSTKNKINYDNNINNNKTYKNYIKNKNNNNNNNNDNNNNNNNNNNKSINR